MFAHFYLKMGCQWLNLKEHESKLDPITQLTGAKTNYSWTLTNIHPSDVRQKRK